MQQQFPADPEPLRVGPSYSLHLSALKPKEREISPWGSIEESKRDFNPARYYQTITNELRETQRQRRNKSTPLADGRESSFKKKLQRGLGPFLHGRSTYYGSNERNSEDYSFRMNLVTVNLDEDAVSPDKKYGNTLDNFHREEVKEQPVRVRIFKKIQQKNQQAEDEYMEKAAEFIQEYEGSPLQGHFGNIDSGKVYQSMPKRNLRISYQRHKGNSTIEPRDTYFPKISEKEEFLCKGEVINGKKEVQSIRRMNFRSAQLEADKNSPESALLFLKKYSYQK